MVHALEEQKSFGIKDKWVWVAEDKRLGLGDVASNLRLRDNRFSEPVSFSQRSELEVLEILLHIFRGFSLRPHDCLHTKLITKQINIYGCILNKGASEGSKTWTLVIYETFTVSG